MSLKNKDGTDLYIELATAREMQAKATAEASQARWLRRAILRQTAWLWGAYARRVKKEITKRGTGSAILAAASKHWDEP